MALLSLRYGSLEGIEFGSVGMRYMQKQGLFP
jgi:hypothetical protein